MTREKQLEGALRECWGTLLLAAETTTDPRLKAAFIKADQICRKTGLDPRAGVVFVDSE